MKVICAWCLKELEGDSRHESDSQEEISHGICPSCSAYFLSGKRPSLADFLNDLAVPVMQVNEQVEVMFANAPALALLGKDLVHVEGFKNGDAMECVNARLPEGCGQTLHCKACTIRHNVTETFETGQSILRTPAYLERWDGEVTVTTRFLISTEKVDDVVLLRIDEVDQD